MKFLKVAVIALVTLIFLVLLGAVIFIKTFDINRFKPQIVDQASSAIGRTVDFANADLALSLTRGVSLRIKGLTIAEDTDFAKGDFLSVKEAYLGVDALGYLLNKKLNVSDLIIDSASVSIIRNKDGTINFLSLTQALQGDKVVEKQKAGKHVVVAAVPALMVSSLKINNAALTYIDRTFEPSLRVELTDIDAALERISLAREFPFSIEAAFLSDRQNIKVSGRAQLDLNKKEVTISGLKADSDLSLFDMTKIAAAFPMVKKEVLPKSMKGGLRVNFKRLTLGENGIQGISADASLANAGLELKQIASAIKDIALDLNINEERIILAKAAAKINAGSIEASGEIKDFLSTQDYNFQTEAENLRLEDILAQDKAPLKAEGEVSFNLKLNGQGLNAQALQSNLSGSGQVAISKLKLKDINILRTVLDKISIIPGLAEKIEENLPQRFKNKLTQEDTVLSDLALPLNIEKGHFLVKGKLLGADEFVFRGSGTIGIDSTYSLEGSFLVNEELSLAMVEAVEQLKYLLNNEKQIYIPLGIFGKAADVTFRVDSEYITKRLIEEQAKKQILKALDKALGIEKQEQQPQQGTQPQGTQPQEGVPKEEKSKEMKIKDAVEGILGDIFGK